MNLLIIIVAAFSVTVTSACGGGDARRAEAEAARAAAEAEKTREREAATAARETRRLADLWSYQDTGEGKMHQVTSAISSVENVDTDGSGAKPVRLIFRDHESWGRSSYLVLQAGDFDCYGKCMVPITVDDGSKKPMAGRRPKTDEAIAMFVNDWQALWNLTRDAKRITIEFPVRAGGTRTATFDVGGLDDSKMPGWNEAATKE